MQKFLCIGNSLMPMLQSIIDYFATEIRKTSLEQSNNGASFFVDRESVFVQLAHSASLFKRANNFARFFDKMLFYFAIPLQDTHNMRDRGSRNNHKNTILYLRIGSEQVIRRTMSRLEPKWQIH